jgi:ribosomal protein L7/L12
MEIAAAVVGLIALFLVLRALSSGRGGQATSHFDPDTDEPSEDLIRQFVDSGQKIQAIKAFRALHGVGLAEAKQAVERMPRRPEPVG